MVASAEDGFRKSAAASAGRAAPAGTRSPAGPARKPRHSVRGIVVHRKHLYVADEAGDAVKIFEIASGRLVARLKGSRLTKPVHLILDGETLYIGAAGTGSVLAYDIPEEAPKGKLKARVVIDGSSRPRRDLRSARMEISTSPNVRSSGPTFLAERQEKGNFHRRAAGYAGVSDPRRRTKA